MPSRACRFAVLGLLWAATAWAGPKDAAKARYQAGEKAFDLGRFDVALKAYEEAYELDPRPALLFNIAQCHRQLKAWERAKFFYNRYLALANNPPNADTVKGFIAEMDLKIKEASQPATAPPQPGEFAVVEPTPPADVPAPPPPVTVVPATPAAVTPAVQPPPPEPPPPAPEKSGGSRWWLWTGLGVLTAGAAVGFVVLASQPKVRVPTLGSVNTRE